MKSHFVAFLVTALILFLLILFGRNFFYREDIVDQSIASYKRLEQSGIPLVVTKDISGAEIAFKDFSSGVVVFAFWASWCAPCVDEFPSIIRLSQRFPEIRVVAVSGDYRKEDIEQFLVSTQIQPSKSTVGNSNIFIQDRSGKHVGQDVIRFNGVKRGTREAPKASGGKEERTSFVVLWDDSGDIRHKFGVTRLPEAFIFNNGVLIKKIVGAIEWTSPDAIKFFGGLANSNQ